MEAAFRVINNTGTAILAGNLKKNEMICIDPYDLILGKKILGSWGGETDIDSDIPYYGKKYLEGKLKLEKLISKEFKLEEINTALELLEKGQTFGRLLINFNRRNS